MLITLGIIGVVAALTIPALINNYQTKAWNTASKVFETKLETSLKVMNSQSTLSGYKTTREFLDEFSKHFKVVNICDDPTECFEKEITWNVYDLSKASTSETMDISKIKTAKDLGQKDWETEVLGVQFADGTAGLIAYNDYDCKQDPYSNEISGKNCIALLYDTSGLKNPNESGKDIRGINSLVNKCLLKSGSACFGPFQKVTEPATQTDCAEMQAAGIGPASCQAQGQNNDRWLGAAKMCGGLKNMPTNDELKNLADIIYGKNTNGGYNTAVTGLNANQEIAENLGLDLSNGIYIWAQEEMSNWYSYYRYFDMNSTKYGATGRGAPNCYVMCKAE